MLNVMYRSPAGPPFTPGPPWPFSLMVCPSGYAQILTVDGNNLFVCLGCICQRDMQFCIIVLAAESMVASATTAASEHGFEEVGEAAAVV